MKCRLRTLSIAVGLTYLGLLTGAEAQREMQPAEQAPADSRLRGSDWLAYFPLETGNEWVYSDGTGSFTVQILGAAQEANGMTYYQVSG